MSKFWIIGTKIEKLGLEIEADSLEDALEIAKDDPDAFEEFGTDEDDPTWTFKVNREN